MPTIDINPSDHGTALQAVNFALDHTEEPGLFLRSWRDGDLADWPEFHDWLHNANR